MRSESSDDCVHGCLSELTVFGGRSEPPRYESQPRKTASPPEEPPANQNDGSMPASLLDGCSVCHWDGHRVCYCSVYCVGFGFTYEGRDGSDQGSESSGAMRMRRMAQARH
jgi:hypothetical protein